MKKILLIVSIFTLIILTRQFSFRVLAQSITPTPSPTDLTPTPSDSEDNDIEKIRQVVKDKVMEKIDQIVNKPNQKIGWLGTIISIDSNNIELENLQKISQKIIVEDEVTIINTKKQTVDLEDLKVDQIIIAMGYLDIEGNLLAKRILITNISLDTLKNTIISATVTDISQTTNIITLVTKDRKVFQVKSDKNTAKIEKNQKIMAVIKPEKKDSNTWLVLDYKDISPPTPTPTPTSTSTEK